MEEIMDKVYTAITKYEIDNPINFMWLVATLTLLLLFIAIIWKIHRNSSYKNFNLGSLFLNESNTKMDDSKTRLNVAFLLTSWVLIHLAILDKLSEWYVAGYLAAWVYDRANSRSLKSITHPQTPQE